MTREEAIKKSSDVSMTREEVIQQLSFWKELWESKKAECDKYENREYACEKKYMLNCNIEVCKIAIEALKQPEQKKGKWIRCENPMYSPFDCSGEYTFRCTVCYKKNNEQTRYCPNCGAQMEVEQ